MGRSLEQCRRLAGEEKVVGKYFPDFQFHNRLGDPHVDGWVRTSGWRKNYKLKLTIPPDFPYSKPHLYVVSPKTLWKRWHLGTINSVGLSHGFHTHGTSPEGFVEICHSRNWAASDTCVKVLLRGIMWLEAYEGHLHTGKNIADFLC